MPATAPGIASPGSARHDLLWSAIREEAAGLAANEPLLASFAHSSVLDHGGLEGVLSSALARKLASDALSQKGLGELIGAAFEADPEIGLSVRADLLAVTERDPACRGLLSPLLFFKGFQAIQAHRVAHWLWHQQREALAYLLQSRSSEVLSVDIHPAAHFGGGILIDHGTGVVIGETAVVEDDVSLLQEVTLGGTGKETGDRHPKIRRGVLIGAGAKILGNIEVGEGAKIGAGSVVLSSVPPHCTAAGVPAWLLGKCGSERPGRDMDHTLREFP